MMYHTVPYHFIHKAKKRNTTLPFYAPNVVSALLVLCLLNNIFKEQTLPVSTPFSCFPQFKTIKISQRFSRVCVCMLCVSICIYVCMCIPRRRSIRVSKVEVRTPPCRAQVSFTRTCLNLRLAQVFSAQLRTRAVSPFRAEVQWSVHVDTKA